MDLKDLTLKSAFVPKAWRVLLLILMLPLFSHAQDGQLTFFEVPGIDGKPLGKIRNVTQDPRGVMWFSGEEAKCLYRYDGTQLTAYRQDFTNPNSLAGVELNLVYADPEGMIWIGFHSGLDRFDPINNVFTHFKHIEGDNASMSDGSVNAVLKDRNGTLWVGTSGGLDRLDRGSTGFIHYRHEPGNPKSLSDDVISGLYEDRKGVLWIATSGYPWADPTPELGGLNRREADGTFTQFHHDSKDVRTLICDNVSAMFEDSHGTFWVGTAQDGLHTMDRTTGKFQRHTYDPVHPDKLSRTPLSKSQWHRDTDIITFFEEDPSGAVWFGGMWGGLTRYDPVNKKTLRYYNSNGYSDTTSWNGFVSRDGVLWIANQHNKLMRTDPVQKRFPHTFVNPEPYREGLYQSRFLENKDGTLWAATGAGLMLLTSTGEVLKQYPVLEGKERLTIMSLLPIGAHEILVGTYKGVFRLNTINGEYNKLDFGVAPAPVITMRLDEDSTIWISNIEAGLIRHELKSGATRVYHTVANDTTSISSNHTIYLLNEKNFLWISTGDNGISRFDKNSGKFKWYLPGGKGTYLFRDNRGVLWGGTSNGLCRLNEQADKFEPAGFNSDAATERIYGVIEDIHQNLWIACPSSVVRIDSARTFAREFGVQNGIHPGSITPGSIFRQSNGNILVGTELGYYKIDPNLYAREENKQEIIMTGFHVNNRDETPQVIRDSQSPGAIVLPHDQNNLSFTFAMPDYRNPESNQFYSMLEGFDNVWRTSSDNVSLYLSVPPGHYTYRVKAYTSGGSLSEKAIAITLLPPWWKTWWAYAGYSLICIGLLIVARRVVISQERLKSNLMLEHMELEKAKEVDKVKNSFFANISHEFRTPLTLIHGPVQEMLESNHLDAKSKDKLSLIKRNADLLLKLINQILDLARVDAGILRLDLREDDIHSFMRAVVSSFESLAWQKGVSLSVEIPLTSCHAMFDRDKLETILINLVNNAIKFTLAGGSVHVAGSVESNQLKLTVRDTGIGIADDQQQKVFVRFHQVSEAHKEVGTGIGLSLVKELVTFMHGQIELSSKLGRGTEFKLTLPVTTVAPSYELKISPTVASTVNGSSGTAKNHAHQNDESDADRYTILVVEDNTDLRSFIISAMGDEYRFLEAENGAEGLERATADIPSLIISDVMMPEMDGISMARKLKASIVTSHIPLILLTAKTSEDSKLEGLKSGADDYLTKPFNKQELILKVRNAIARQDKLREKLRADLMSTAPPVAVMSDDEKFLERVKNIVLERLSDPQLGVESLSDDIGLSRSQLFRKISALTGLSVVELIRKIRLQRAAQLLEKNWGPVTQVAYEVGFSNPSYFTKCFREEFGRLPSEYGVELRIKN
ncbi:MAG: two-component regulator propeller domain-containing protein [Chryseolinea sp.]